MNYSQNNEQEIVLKYFGDHVGTVLDCGANDGETFSNSRALLLSGWTGVLIEPNPEAFAKLVDLYGNGDPRYILVNAAIGRQTGSISLHCNTPHIPGDTGLLSTTVVEEKERWKMAVQYKPVTVDCYTFEAFHSLCAVKRYDFITIDAEGLDWAILKQIDLDAVACRLLCIEWNSNPEMLRRMTDYAAQFGMKEISRNNENVILAR